MAPKRRIHSVPDRLAVKKRPSAGGPGGWNVGLKQSKSSKQHLYTPRDEMELFFAVLLFFGGSVCAVVLWLSLTTSRRISETLRLRGEDLCIKGGGLHDRPHVRFEKRDDEMDISGMGKLGTQGAIARLSPEAVRTIEGLASHGARWEIRAVLSTYQAQFPDVFAACRPVTRTTYYLHFDDKHLFPSLTKAKQPWMTRQTVWRALGKARVVIFQITGRRRYNPMFLGQHVTVHGATRHTAASLLLWNPEAPTEDKPSEDCIMEIQQRNDRGTFRKHYHHVHENEVQRALLFAATLDPFSQSMMSSATDDEPGTAATAAPSASSGDVVPATPKSPGLSGDAAMAPPESPGLSGDAAPAPPKSPGLSGDAAVARLESPGVSGDAAGLFDVAVVARAGPGSSRVHSHGSRNAWRKKKRREGYIARLARGAAETQD